MTRRNWMACLGLLAAAGAASAQTPPKTGLEELPAATSFPVAAPVATVGGVPISVAELQAALRQADSVTPPQTERQQAQHRARALGILIDGVLMRKFLESNTRPIDPAAVERRLAELEADLRRQEKSLAEFCQETRKTVDQVKADIADQLRWSRFEAENLTDTILMHFYKENKAFFDGVTVRASHIVVRVPPGASDTTRAAAREKLLALRKQLMDDPKLDFDELARHQPDKGGDLGPIPRKWYDEQFTRAALALTQGQVSEIVQTDFGMHLIKVTDRRAGKDSDFVRMREAVREFCSQDLRRKILAEQRKTVEIRMNFR